MLMHEIPAVDYAIIGGTGTWAKNFPEDLNMSGVQVLRSNMEFDTPFGRTVPMKLLELSASLTSDHKPRRLLTVPFHGYHGLSPYNTPSEQVFWVFQKAGVKVVIAEGSVGSLNPLLDPGDIVIPHDFCDLTKRPSTLHNFTNKIIRMGKPLCHYLRSLLMANTKEEYNRVFPRGVYGVLEAPRYETSTEIRMMRSLGCDITGHTLVPEIVLARAIGACYASLYIVSNYGEGVVESDWVGDSLFEHYDNCFNKIGSITIKTIAQYDPTKADCSCSSYMIDVPETIQHRISED